MGNEIHNQKREKSNINTISKCSECELSCILKKGLLNKNKNAVCPIPESQEHARMYNHPVVDANILYSLATKTLNKINNNIKTPQDLKNYFQTILQFKQAFHPAIQKSENLNVNINAAKEMVNAVILDITEEK